MSTTFSTAFVQAFGIVVGHEGGFTNNPADPGNWTGGAINSGTCNGTCYGISAASYPTLDIQNLTLDQAEAIYKSDYWDKLFLDTADPSLALVAFDASVNNGVGRATQWLQAALGVTADGQFGPISQAALVACTGSKVAPTLVNMHARRLVFMVGLSTWSTFGVASDGGPGGWATRLVQIPYQAANMMLPSGASA